MDWQVDSVLTRCYPVPVLECHRSCANIDSSSVYVGLLSLVQTPLEALLPNAGDLGTVSSSSVSLL